MNRRRFLLGLVASPVGALAVTVAPAMWATFAEMETMDPAARAAAYRVYLASGLMTANEVRRLEYPLGEATT